MHTMQTESLLAEHCGDQLRLTLNRPDKANAITVGMSERLLVEIRRAGEDTGVRSILLTGAGDRLFSAGVDVREQPEGMDMAAQRERRSRATAALQDAILDCPKPVIVVLNGSAIGGAAMLALLADACVAVDSAELSLPEIDIGIASFSGFAIAAVIGGRAVARDLIQSGRRMTAAEACGKGLIARAVPRAQLAQAAAEIADKLGGKKPAVFADNKRWINRAMKAALAEARDEHARHRAAAAQ